MLKKLVEPHVEPFLYAYDWPYANEESLLCLPYSQIDIHVIHIYIQCMTKSSSKKSNSYNFDKLEKHTRASQVMESEAIAYKSGNSTVVTLPRSFGFKPGDKFKFKKVDEYGPTIEKVEEGSHDKEVEAKMRKFKKMIKSLKVPPITLTAEELDDLAEGMYD